MPPACRIRGSQLLRPWLKKKMPTLMSSTTCTARVRTRRTKTPSCGSRGSPASRRSASRLSRWPESSSQISPDTIATPACTSSTRRQLPSSAGMSTECVSDNARMPPMAGPVM